MTHDPLCPVAYTEAEIYWRTKCPYCRQIAKVREDMLAKCIAAIEQLLHKPGAAGEHYLTALRALQEKP